MFIDKEPKINNVETTDLLTGRLSRVMDRKYYRSFWSDIPEGKEVEHFIDVGIKSNRRINPLYMHRFVKDFYPSVENEGRLFLDYLISPINDKIPPHSTFKYEYLDSSHLHKMYDNTDLLHYCMHAVPKNLRTLQIFSMLGGGRIFLNSLARSLYGNHFIDHVMDGIPSSDGYAFSGHLWNFKAMNEGVPPSKTQLILSKAEALEIEMIMCLRHPLDSFLSIFYWLMNQRKIISQKSEDINELFNFFNENLKQLREFERGGGDGGRYPSFREFLEESIFFFDKPYIHKFRLEDFSFDLQQSTLHFYEIASKDHTSDADSVLLKINAGKPSTEPWRFRRLMEVDKTGQLSDYLNTLIDANAASFEKLSY